MKRRRFLRLLGAATTAPMLPLSGTAAATAAPAGYTAAQMHGAILHATSSSHISRAGLARLLRCSGAQAETLMADMARRNIIRPLTGSAAANGWAASAVYRRPAPLYARIARTKAKADAQATNATRPRRAVPPEPDLDLMLAHLHRICRAYGMTIAA